MVISYLHSFYSQKLFYSFFKSLLDRNLTVVVELKNGVEIEGTLDYVDDKLNFNLTNIQIKDKVRYPMLAALKSMFIRGSSIRYI